MVPMPLLPFPKKKSKLFWLVVSLLLVTVVGALDYLTGYELAFSPFYLLPVIVSAWYVGRNTGLVFAGLSALTWFAADFATGHSYTTPVFYFWNTLLRGINFLVVVWLVTSLKSERDMQTHLARTDAITGLANTRWFHEFLEQETARVSRYRKPISVMYIDLDNFKQVNDRSGHREGDRALLFVADTLRKHLRKTDFVARVGGDEFAVVLTETGPEIAPQLSEKILSRLCAEMEKENWPITFSMGVVTAQGGSYIIPPEAILHQADDLMYEVKRSGKNNVRWEAYKVPLTPQPPSPSLGKGA